MKNIPRNVCLLTIVLITFSTCSPLEKKKLNWYKGNLHTHTYWSDGDEFPEMVLDWYKNHGYDFVALSDHNTMAIDEKWKLITNSPLYEESFRKYLEKFGEEWVEYKTDTGRIQVKLKTFPEYKSKMEEAGFLVIPSEEITNNVNNAPVHINATNLQEFVAPPNAATVAETMQQTIDAVLEQRRRTGVPMFTHINHPNFYWAITLEDMVSLKGEQFFEVYNGHPMVRNYGDSTHLSTEAMWDKINVAYANRNQSLMFGLGTDDSHNYHQFGEAFSNAGRGWVMVQAESLETASLIMALEAGNFYSSTGVTLRELVFENNDLKVKVAPEKEVNYTIEFIGVRKDEKEARIIKTLNGNEGSFSVSDEFLFVRARVISTKRQSNPFQEGDYEMAWTQPVMFSKY